MAEQEAPVIPTAGFYDSMGESYQSVFGLDTGLHSFIEDILKHLPPHAAVLDVGCGTGKPVAYTLVASGHRVVGIDFAPSMVDLSRQQVPGGEFENADMLQYSSKEKFDAILNVLSLFSLSRKEMEKMSRKWAEWLSPNGIVCIATIAAEDCQPSPDMYDGDGKCASGIKFRFMGNIVPLTLFSKEGWSDLLTQAGFEIVHTQIDVFSPPAAAESDDETHYFIIARKVS